MIKNIQCNIRISELDKKVLNKLAQLNNLSLSQYIVLKGIPKRLPSNLDEKFKKAIKQQEQTKKLDLEFNRLNSQSRWILKRSYTISNIKTRLFDLMWKGINHNTIYDYLQHALKYSKVLPNKMIRQEKAEWNIFKKLTRLRCKTLQKIFKVFKESGFPKHLIIDLSHDFGYILSVYNIMNSDGVISFERYKEMIEVGDFKELENRLKHKRSIKVYPK